MMFPFIRMGRSAALSWRAAGCVVLITFATVWLRIHKINLGKSRVEDVAAPIHNSTLGFQKIFVLNLPARTDHADWMKLCAAATDLEVDFVEGVNGDDVLDKVMPYPPHRDLGKGNIGSWRAHMNAMARIVAGNITTALVMEDDVDWDVRIKHQMQNFAAGTRALSQPVMGTTRQYADPTFLQEKPAEPQPRHEALADDMHFDFYEANTPTTARPNLSPYGDDWDVLWLGHCSMQFPRARDKMAKGRYIILDDETMIPRSKIASGDPIVWPGTYPDFSRIVHHAWDPICSYAYAVSQRGARKILYEFGIRRFDRAFDNMMAEFCDMHICLTIQPQLISSFAAPGPVNRDSEINGFGQENSKDVRDRGSSENIQRSVRLNLQAILHGHETIELRDQYPRDTVV